MSIASDVQVCSSILKRLSLDSTVFGTPVCTALSQQFARLDVQRPLLFRDPNATDASGISDELHKVLSGGNVIDVSSTLQPSEVDCHGELLRQEGFDCVVAVGGGATMDAAKLVALSGSNDRNIVDLQDGEVTPNQYPIIAAPTTAGSGSEATQFAVLYVDERKYSVAHPSLLPRVAIVDPSLTCTAPERVAVAAGLDALCQSVESLWARRADVQSRAHASESLRLVVANLAAATIQRDPQAQTYLALASHLAGHAINRSTTTICHALSYYLTSHYGTPHGIAAAATLPSALLFNSAGANAGRCLNELYRVLECDDAESVSSRLAHLIRSVGAAACVQELYLPDDYNPAEHAASINLERLANNPRTANLEDVEELLRGRFDTYQTAT